MDKIFGLEFLILGLVFQTAKTLYDIVFVILVADGKESQWSFRTETRKFAQRIKKRRSLFLLLNFGTTSITRIRKINKPYRNKISLNHGGEIIERIIELMVNQRIFGLKSPT
jgi:hypothetical protein